MSKATIIDLVAEKAGLTKSDASKAVNAFLEGVQEQIKQEGLLALVGFGTFKLKERAARKGRNPQTGEEIEIKAAKVVSFSAGKSLKDSVNS